MKRPWFRPRLALSTRWSRRAAMVLALVVTIALVAAISPALLSGPTTTVTSIVLAGDRASSGLNPASATHATNSSCPTTGPLGSLDTVWTVVVLVVTALVGLCVGIGLGRWSAPRKPLPPREPALNPQPLPPGIYAPGQGPGGEVGQGERTMTPALNPQPLPPGMHRPPETGPGGDQST